MEQKIDLDASKSWISDQIIGNDLAFKTPYGTRKLLYLDHVASGRGVRYIEEFIQTRVMKLYGNTHSLTTLTGVRTMEMREEARDIIRNATNASEHDAIIFTGSGSTGALHKLVHALDVKNICLKAGSPAVVVLYDDFAHHSSILPWREAGATTIRIPLDQNKEHIDSTVLEAMLKKVTNWKPHRIICCFTAASNVTGLLSDVDAISILVHKYKGFVVWDYATAAPYTTINMHPLEPLASKDAVVFSMHKFLGGVGAPGVLITKRSIFNDRPSENGGGGGSVFYVTKDNHRYLKHVESREEAGTPDIIGSIRAGLAFQLKQRIGAQSIHETELKMAKTVLEKLKLNPNIHILGPSTCDRLPVISFLVFHKPSNLYLHYNFISALLNDLFGIQTRGGCACAGPYAQELLGLDDELNHKYEEILLEDDGLDRTHLRRYAEHGEVEMLRPGFVRMNIPWFLNDDDVDAIVDALHFVADHGWKFLTDYKMNLSTAQWKHHKDSQKGQRLWLSDVITTNEGPILPNIPGSDIDIALDVQTSLHFAQDQLNKVERSARNRSGTRSMKCMPDNAEELRWFLYPDEAAWYVSHSTMTQMDSMKKSPFLVSGYGGSAIQASSINLETLEVDFQHAITAMEDQLQSLSSHLSKVKAQEQSSVSNSNYQPTLVRKADIDRFLEGVDIATSSSIVDDVTEHEDQNTDESSEGDNSDEMLFEFMENEEDGDETMKENGSMDSTLSTEIKFHAPPKQLVGHTLKGVEKFDMIENGDKVLICVSGGKDSLSLLHVMKQIQRIYDNQGIHFELGAATVDPGTDSYDPSPLIDYMKALGVPYFYESQRIFQKASNIQQLGQLASICSFCSRMKRGRLYACARREGYNVLAFGQHLDDLAESFMMSVFHNGLLNTMKANYSVEDGDLRVIRPFVFIREKMLRNFAEDPNVRLPVINENCPACFDAPTERQRVKELLASQELIHPRLFDSLKSALVPLMARKRRGDDQPSEACDYVV